MRNTLELSHLSLRVADLQRSVDFYAGRLGFTVQSSTGHLAQLGLGGSGPAHLQLEEYPGLHPAAPEATGLFHGAVLLSDRRALGAWLGLAARRGVDFDGFADHGVSEAIYLADPDGNGLEFYADRPRSAWPFAGGQLAMFTRPLAVRELVAAGGEAGEQPLAGARWGHLHLRVADLGAATHFCHRELGVVVTQSTFPGACFLAADGYHHHVGLNTWGSPRRAPTPEETGLSESRWQRAGTGTPRRIETLEGFALVIEPLPAAS